MFQRLLGASLFELTLWGKFWLENFGQKTTHSCVRVSVLETCTLLGVFGILGILFEPQGGSFWPPFLRGGVKFCKNRQIWRFLQPKIRQIFLTSKIWGDFWGVFLSLSGQKLHVVGPPREGWFCQKGPLQGPFLVAKWAKNALKRAFCVRGRDTWHSSQCTFPRF